MFAALLVVLTSRTAHGCTSAEQGACEPLGVISKTMRHSTLSVTVNIYGHLARHTAHQAVDALATTLNTTQTQAA